MKTMLLKHFIFLFGLIISSVSYSQSSKEVINDSLKTVDGTTNTESTKVVNTVASPSDWHSENSVDGVVTISKKKNQPQVIHNKAYFESEIIRIDNHVKAINSKIEAVNADQNLKSEALNTGWFDNMERIKRELEAQKLDAQNALIKIEKK